MQPVDLKAIQLNPSFAQPLAMVTLGQVVQPPSFSQLPTENAFVQDAKRLAAHWNRALQVSNSIAFIVMLVSLVQDLTDSNGTITLSILIEALGVILSVKGVQVATNLKVEQARRYLIWLGCYVFAVAMGLLFVDSILEIALINDNLNGPPYNTDLLSMFLTFHGAFAATMIVCSFYILIAYKAIKTRRVLAALALRAPKGSHVANG